MRKGILSLEAIHFQTSGFFEELKKAFEESWAENGSVHNYKEAIESASAKKILEIIKRHTNLTMVYSTRYPDNGPAIIPASIRPDHVFHNEQLHKDSEFLSYFSTFAQKSKNKVLTGSVDLKNAKVHGFFAEEVNELLLPTDFLCRGSFYGTRMTPGEAAAVVLHEVGHGFTFMEFVTRINSANQVLAYLSDRRLNTTPDHFQVVVANVSKAFGLTKEQQAALEKAKDDKETAVLLLAMNDEKTRSELGVSMYDSVSAEQLADQFATRFGAGPDLIEILDRVGGLEVWRNRTRYGWVIDAFFVAVCGLAITVPGGIGLLGCYYLILFTLDVAFTGSFGDTYDNAEHRPARVMQDMVEKLKDKELTSDERKSLIEAVENLQKLIETKKEFPDLAQYVALLLKSSYRKSYNYEILQKQLEAIASNHLFVKSAKLRTIAETI